jgi:hypothetical protein
VRPEEAPLAPPPTGDPSEGKAPSLRKAQLVPKRERNGGNGERNVA